MCSDSDTSNISQSSFIVEQRTLVGNSEDDIVFQPNVTEVFSDESNLSTIGDQCGISCRMNYDSLTHSLPTSSHDREKYGNIILLSIFVFIY